MAFDYAAVNAAVWDNWKEHCPLSEIKIENQPKETDKTNQMSTQILGSQLNQESAQVNNSRKIRSYRTKTPMTSSSSSTNSSNCHSNSPSEEDSSVRQVSKKRGWDDSMKVERACKRVRFTERAPQKSRGIEGTPENKAVALRLLGHKLANGDGIKKNEKLALKKFQAAAGKGDVIALYNIGYFYENGLGGLKPNDQKAFESYKLCADKGNSEAQYKVATMLDEDGDGEVESNRSESFKYYLLAANQGHASAQLSVAICYETGKADIQSHELALKFYKMSADQNFPEALCAMGKLYEEGKLVEKNLQLALDFYRKGADLGDEDAQFNLDLLEEVDKLPESLNKLDLSDCQNPTDTESQKSHAEAVQSGKKDLVSDSSPNF